MIIKNKIFGDYINFVLKIIYQCKFYYMQIVYLIMARWTEAETAFLKENYLKISNKEISKAIGKSIDSIWTKATRIGLTNKHYFSDGIHCLKCGSNLSDSNWSKSQRTRKHHVCKTCFNTQQRDRCARWREKNPDYQKNYWNSPNGRIKTINKRLRYQYGITYEEALQIEKEQDYKCAICKKPFDQSIWHNGMTLTYLFVIDHNHSTKKVRGLLCQPCNTLIGYAKEDITILENAIAYLKKYS